MGRLRVKTSSLYTTILKDFNASFEWLATGRGHFRLGVGEKSSVYQRLTDDEGRLLDAFRNLPKAKRKLLLEFLS